MARGTSRLAYRHFLAVLLVTVVISAGELLSQARVQFNRGTSELDEVLETIENSYLPSVATGVFFFDEQQVQLLAEGIALLPYVNTVFVLERRAERNVPIVSAGAEPSTVENEQIHEYPLYYDSEGERREVGLLRVITDFDQLRAQIAEQLRVSTAAHLLRIIGFAVVILLVVQRMVFRHLWTITRFFEEFDPEDPGKKELILTRRAFFLRNPDELDEITTAINSMLHRQERALKERSALVQELFHRTGNTVQSVQAILHLQSSRHSDNEPLQMAVRAANNRILAIALAQQKLYLGGNLSRIGMEEYLSELAQEIFQSYQPRDGALQLKTHIEGVSVLIDTAIPCGMVVCELLSNSLEHAFPDEGDGGGESTAGTIAISLTQTAGDGYTLTVSDNGAGLGSVFDIRRDGGMGIQVVLSIVEDQLNGQATCEADNGVHWSIQFSDTVYRERVAHG